jgi:hypothetical protein
MLPAVAPGRRAIMAKKDPNTQERFRRADNGQYTTEKYADKHPKTTVKETDKKPPKK